MTKTPTLADQVRQALATVKDPCMVAGGLDLSIVDLGLITAVETNDTDVAVTLTFTEVGCQFTHRVIDAMYTAIESVPGVGEIQITPQWDKAWTPDWMSPAGRKAFTTAKSRFAARFTSTPVSQDASQ